MKILKTEIMTDGKLKKHLGNERLKKKKCLSRLINEVTKN
jgi:hypothetical protein